MRRKSWGALLFVPTLAIGCAEPADVPPDVPGLTIRDSMGVQIVELEEGAVEALPRWEVDPVPILDIGGDEGRPESQLFSVSGVVGLPGGGVVVGNDGSKELIWFDGDGQVLRRRGGDGEGPGEFRNVAALFRAGSGGVVATDERLRQLTRFGWDGELLGTESYRPRDDMMISRVFGLDSTGAVIGAGRTVGDGVRPCGPPGEAEALTSFRAGSTTPIGCIPSSPYGVVAAAGIGILWAPVVHAPASVSASEHGLIHGAARDGTIRLLSAGGEVSQLIRWAHPPPQVDAAVLDSILDRVASVAPLERRQGIRDAMVRSTERSVGDTPLVLPSFTIVRWGADGSIWARLYRTGDATFNPEVTSFGPTGTEAVEYLIIAPDGVPRATVLAPPRLELHEASGDYLLGVWRDEFDIEHVRMYRIAPPSA